jgi:hypothetical protein
MAERQGGDGSTGELRHQCEGADHQYAAGVALLFYDVRLREWRLAKPDAEEYRAWDRDRHAEHPLQYRIDAHYAWVMAVDFCPWCGLELSEDPVSKGRRKAT